MCRYTYILNHVIQSWKSTIPTSLKPKRRDPWQAIGNNDVSIDPEDNERLPVTRQRQTSRHMTTRNFTSGDNETINFTMTDNRTRTEAWHQLSDMARAWRTNWARIPAPRRRSTCVQPVSCTRSLCNDAKILVQGLLIIPGGVPWKRWNTYKMRLRNAVIHSAIWTCPWKWGTVKLCVTIWEIRHEVNRNVWGSPRKRSHELNWRTTLTP